MSRISESTTKKSLDYRQRTAVFYANFYGLPCSDDNSLIVARILRLESVPIHFFTGVALVTIVFHACVGFFSTDIANTC